MVLIFALVLVPRLLVKHPLPLLEDCCCQGRLMGAWMAEIQFAEEHPHPGFTDQWRIPFPSVPVIRLHHVYGEPSLHQRGPFKHLRTQSSLHLGSRCCSTQLCETLPISSSERHLLWLYICKFLLLHGEKEWRKPRDFMYARKFLQRNSFLNLGSSPSSNWDHPKWMIALVSFSLPSTAV